VGEELQQKGPTPADLTRELLADSKAGFSSQLVLRFSMIVAMLLVNGKSFGVVS
jgi:hypothetical protein